jgi:anti-sigma factor RsiW
MKTPDEEIERYLLGRLDESDSLRVEERYFHDEALFDAVQDAEDRLIRRYLRGELPKEERSAFEAHFAAGSRRQQQIAFHRLVMDARGDTPVAGDAGAPAPRGRRLAAWSAVAAALVAATVVGWLLARPAPTLRSGPATAPPASASPSQVASLLLHAGSLRERERETPRLKLADATSEVLLRAEIPWRGAARIEASLRTVEGPEVWRGQGQVDSDVIAVHVPRDRLAAGDYVLILSDPAGGRSSDYFFRVSR